MSKKTKSDQILEGEDASLLDLLDDVLNKGVLVDGELVLGVADVDLIYLRLSTVLAAADKILGSLDGKPRRKRGEIMAAKIPALAPPAAKKKKAKR